MKTLILDTETTDLIKNKMMPLERQPKIIEFYGLSLGENGEELDSIHFLFHPGTKLGDDTKRITGITDEMLSGAGKFSDSAEEIKAFIESHSAVVAHNLSYDRSMVDFEMKRAGLKVSWPELICTVESTVHMKGHRLNLAALYELLFSESFSGAHRAENDVRALARCFTKLRELNQV